MNSAPTALFDSYEQDFQQFIKTIGKKLEGDGSNEHGGRLLKRLLQRKPQLKK